MDSASNQSQLLFSFSRLSSSRFQTSITANPWINTVPGVADTGLDATRTRSIRTSQRLLATLRLTASRSNVGSLSNIASPSNAAYSSITSLSNSVRSQNQLENSSNASGSTVFARITSLSMDSELGEMEIQTDGESARIQLGRVA